MRFIQRFLNTVQATAPANPRPRQAHANEPPQRRLMGMPMPKRFNQAAAWMPLPDEAVQRRFMGQDMPPWFNRMAVCIPSRRQQHERDPTPAAPNPGTDPHAHGSRRAPNTDLFPKNLEPNTTRVAFTANMVREKPSLPADDTRPTFVNMRDRTRLQRVVRYSDVPETSSVRLGEIQTVLMGSPLQALLMPPKARNKMTACEKSGMPSAHGKCFQKVADARGDVIVVRAVGKFATGLILEGYASKGFHVKAKSCDWGPMAGFVLSDPRLTKRGTAIEGQRKAIHAAFNDGAAEMPVYLSEDRRKELIKMACMAEVTRGGNEIVYSAISPANKRMKFVLKEVFDAPGAGGKSMWAVFFHQSEPALPGQLKAPPEHAGTDLVPVMALVDPKCDPKLKGTYRAAMTADYDLWGVLAKAKDTAQSGLPLQTVPGPVFDPKGLDKRPVPGSERVALPIRDYIQHEDPDEGNITQRIRDVKAMLNSEIRATGYPGGDMVHHSDEVGRPNVNEFESHFIVFIPGQKDARFVENHAGFGEVMKETMKYQFTPNPGWGRELGFLATPKGNWET